ncbi:MAG: Stealth CR1 domain-containing protein [Bacteroidaceae bacterium]|nr:Stealth CR1 domain-containing protein [Bacteroidaceae bacterium]
MKDEGFSVDVVITWVDGGDAALNAKRAKYMGGDKKLLAKDIAGTTRYVQRGEIHWCVRSVNKFMPWVRRIFIVTDGQNPNVESRIPVEIIDHKVIFQSFEQYLPTFNSLSIEAMLWRIPGLSEHFVYLNDDVLICRPVTPECFFPKPGHIVCHGHLASMPWTRLRYAVKERFGTCPVNHVRQMMLAAEIAGSRGSFIRLSHTPHPLLRSTLEKFYNEHPRLLVQNIKERFRSRWHFRTDELCYMLLLSEGRLQLQRVRPVLMRYYGKTGMMQLEWTLRRVTRPGSKVCFACFYALEQVSVKIYARICRFADDLLREGV